MPANAIPTVDLDTWRTDPAAVAAQVDTALQRAGFLLVTGHGVDAELRAGVRAAARRFFALPAEVKQRYAVRIGGRGWLAPGVEANGLVEGTQTPPDLKESFAAGPDTPTGDAAVDAVWFPPNVWPAEVPELRAVVTRYTDAMRRVADDLLELCAGALDLPAGTLTSLATNPTWTFNINRYPPLTEVGEPAQGQYRIGPHTDFGTVTVLDREPGAGGLQVFVTAADDPDGPGVWQDAPYDPDALTVNIGDLLVALDRAAVELGAAPGAAAAGCAPGRGADVARVLLRARPRRRRHPAGPSGGTAGRAGRRGERAVHPGTAGRDLGGLSAAFDDGPLVGCRGRILESASGTRARG